MKGELLQAVAALAGFGSVALLLFLFNLAATPFRQERDRRLASDARATEAEAKVQHPKFEIDVGQIIFGGSAVGSPGVSMVLMPLTVSNVGHVASSIKHWRLLVRSGETQIQGRVTVPHPEESIDCSMTHSQEPLSLKTNDFIPVRSLERLEPGSLIQGYLLATVPATAFANPENLSAIAEGIDVYGNIYRAERSLIPAEEKQDLTYLASYLRR